MKKIFYSIIVAGLALVSAACQKLDEQIITPGASNDLTVTASIVNFDGTKVSYEFTDPENSKSGIKPSWVNGDAIFGFDDKGGTFSFTVSSITDGKATFSTTGYSPAEGVTKLYAVYYPGKIVSDLENNALSVDLSSQSGTLDGNAPAIMCATGTIKNDAVNFAFTNQTAVVGIYKMQVYKDGAALATSPITGVSLGNVLTQGTVKLEGGEFKLYPSADHGIISATGLELTTDGEGCVEVTDPSNTYFAVIPEENASITVNASDETTSYKTNASITGNINAGSYYYLGKKIYGGEVAKIGGTSYATISEAFAAATDGETIQLQNDCDFDSQITLAGKSGEITLDLNGCTLKNGPTLNNKQSRFYLNTEATLVIRDSQTDGKITSDKVDQDIIRIIKGNLKVVSGTIEAPAATDGGNAAIWVAPASEGTTTNASVTVTGGKILGPATVSTDDKRAYALYVDNPGADVSVSGGEFSAQSNSMRIMDANSVNITGGTFECETSSEYTLRIAASAGKPYTCSIGGNASVSSANSAVYAYGTDDLTLNVSGGKFKTTGTAGIIIRDKPKTAEVYPTISISGGLFSKAPATARLAATYGLCDNTDSETSETYPCKVARPLTLAINGGEAQYFASIEAAVDEANKDDNKALECKIKLLESVTMGSSAKNVSNTAGVTLDLNGNTLTQNGSSRLGVTTDGKLTITDEKEGKLGKITQNSVSSYAIKLENGEMTIAGGTIDCVSGQKYATVYVTGGTLYVQDDAKILSDGKSAVSVDNGGTVNVSGGELHASGQSSYGISASGEISVSNGTVISDDSNGILVSEGSKLTITGGYFAGKGTGTNGLAPVYKAESTTAEVKISGGYYSKEVPDGLLVTTPERYACVANDDDATKAAYPFKVVEFSAVATVTIEGSATPIPCASVEAAVDEVNKSENSEKQCTITLIAEPLAVASQAVITNKSGVTLDLNDQTLTFSGNNRVYVGSDASLTIRDNGTNKTGTITQDQNANVIVVNSTGSTLTIESGKITYPTDVTGFNYAVVYVTNGTLNIKGGEIAANRTGISMNNGAVVVSDSGKVSSTGGSAISVSGGALTVSGSAEVSSTAENSTISVSGTGDLTVTGGEIGSTTNTTGKGYAAINLGEGTGIVNISGGDIHANRVAINLASNSQHQVTLSGDCKLTSANTNVVYSSSTVAAPNNSTVTVTGGKYKAGGSSTAVFSVYSTSSTTTKYQVSSCKFYGNIADSRLAPFCRNANNTDSDSAEYPKKVEYYVPVTLAIGSGEAQPYASVEAAVEEANDDANKTTACTITLNDNCTMGSSAINVSNTAGVTLDLNGKTLTQNGTNRLDVTTGGKLIIADSSSDKSGAVTQSSGNAFAVTAGTLVINAGKISTSANNNAISISGGDVEINGDNVSITSPNVPNTSAATSVVRLGSGSLKLVKGTIGSSTNSGDNGNYTAVAVANGTFTMTGGYLYARRHAIIFSGTSGTGTATISGGRLETTANGWILVRFQANSINKLTVDGGGFFVKETNDYPGKLFYGKDKSNVIPTNAGVTINAGYFSQSPSGITRVTVNGTVSAKGSYTYDEKTYSYTVE